MYRLGLSILALQSLQHLGAQGLPQVGFDDWPGIEEFIIPGSYVIDTCVGNEAMIENAIQSAKTVAKAAVDVLEDSTKSSNEYVKRMLMDLVGVDDVSHEDIQKARKNLKTIAGIEKAGMFGLVETNTDVRIKCTDAHYGKATTLDGREYTRHTPSGNGMSALQAGEKVKCFGTPGNTRESLFQRNLPMAVTINSDRYNAQGQVVEQKEIAATMDLCPWYLNFVQGFGNDYSVIDRALLEKVANPDFELNSADGFNSEADVLSQSLAGTILHEMAHTRLGGLARDEGSACYGWGCVKILKSVNNADTINLIGVALWVWSEGFYIDSDGNIRDQPS